MHAKAVSDCFRSMMARIPSCDCGNDNTMCLNGPWKKLDFEEKDGILRHFGYIPQWFERTMHAGHVCFGYDL